MFGLKLAIKADMVQKNVGHKLNVVTKKRRIFADSESIGKVAQKFTRNKLSTKKLWENGVFLLLLYY